MSIGAQKNVKLIDQLRTKIASSISQLNVEDPNETTPPSVSAEQPTVAPGQMTPTTSEEKPNVGMESMPANGDAQDEAATDQMKLASKASRIVDMLARIKKASNEEAATANGGEALAPKPADGNAQEEDTMTDGEAAPEPVADAKVDDAKVADAKVDEAAPTEEAKEANTELDVAALISFMDRSALSKLAYVVLSNDKVAGDLIQDVESLTEKSAALRLLDDALEASEAEYYEKSAALEIENALGARINRMDKNEVEHLTKSAAFHQQFLDKELSTDMLKQAYVEGADAAAMAEQGEGELPLPAEEAPASIEEVAGALEEMVQDGEITPEQAEEILTPLAEEAAAGEGAADVGPEEVVQALDEMVQSGEISEEEAIAVAEEVLAPAMEGAEAAPVEAAPMEEVKAAARRFVRKQAMTKEVPVEEDDEYGDYAEGLPSDEEILAILGEMVESGEISEEEAIAIVEEAAAGGEAPAEEAPAEEEVKEAAAEEAMGGELPSDDEVLEALGEMVDSGEISEEEAIAIVEEAAAGGEAPVEEEVKEAAAEEAMGGELPSDEEVLEALGEMVDSGEISEEEAMGIIEQAASTGAEEAPVEEAPVEGGEAAPSDDEVLEALGEMVDSGEISEEEAMALLEQSAA